jgi:hypothetical protein
VRLINAHVATTEANSLGCFRQEGTRK